VKCQFAIGAIVVVYKTAAAGGKISKKRRATYRDPDMSIAPRDSFMSVEQNSFKDYEVLVRRRPLVWSGAVVVGALLASSRTVPTMAIVDRYRINTNQVFQEQKPLRY
jgi:hypothetical protein